MFFFLLQTEQGDIFKCTLETDEEMVMVTEIRLKYFDTTPIASSMCVLKTGFLFVASEFGNQYVSWLLWNTLILFAWFVSELSKKDSNISLALKSSFY
jgi:hypothetical protein